MKKSLELQIKINRLKQQAIDLPRERFRNPRG